MSLTIAPAIEACQALVTQINGGSAYTLPQAAEYSQIEIDPLEEISGLRVDVTAVDEEQLEETLSVEDRTRHEIHIWVRKKLPDLTQAAIDAVCLIVRQIFQRVNNFNSVNGRVKVWEVDKASKMTPDKTVLKTANLFVASIILRVEVEAST